MACKGVKKRLVELIVVGAADSHPAAEPAL